MNLGADRKKVIALAAIVVFGGGLVYYANFYNSESAPAPVSRPAVAISAAPVVQQPIPGRGAARQTERRRVTNQGLVSDWVPRLGPKNPEDRPDPATIDPSIRLDLLAKVQKVPLEGGSRNLFEFYQPPPPPPPKVTIKPGPVAPVKPAEVVKPVDSAPPPPPPPPPIPLKFYGYAGTTRDGMRRAFFLDGDDIYTAAENETVKGRYKIIRIGVNSAVVEDTTNKHEQTLPLVQESDA